MREQRKLKKIAEQSLRPLCDDITKQLEAEFPAPSGEAPRNKIKWSGRLTALISAASSAVCCSIALVCAFLITGFRDEPRRESGAAHGGTSYNYTVKDYNIEHGTNILYLDWYDTADYCESYRYVYTSTQEVLGMSEIWKKDGLNVMVQSEFASSPADLLSARAAKCTETEQLEMCELKWYSDDEVTSGVFEYGERTYCVTLLDVADKDKLVEIIYQLFL